MFIICLIIGKYINSNFVSLIIQVIAGGCVYGVVLLILKDNMVIELLNRVKILIHIK